MNLSANHIFFICMLQLSSRLTCQDASADLLKEELGIIKEQQNKALCAQLATSTSDPHNEQKQQAFLERQMLKVQQRQQQNLPQQPNNPQESTSPEQQEQPCVNTAAQANTFSSTTQPISQAQNIFMALQQSLEKLEEKHDATIGQSQQQEATRAQLLQTLEQQQASCAKLIAQQNFSQDQKASVEQALQALNAQLNVIKQALKAEKQLRTQQQFNYEQCLVEQEACCKKQLHLYQNLLENSEIPPAIACKQLHHDVYQTIETIQKNYFKKATLYIDAQLRIQQDLSILQDLLIMVQNAIPGDTPQIAKLLFEYQALLLEFFSLEQDLIMQEQEIIKNLCALKTGIEPQTVALQPQESTAIATSESQKINSKSLTRAEKKEEKRKLKEQRKKEKELKKLAKKQRAS